MANTLITTGIVLIAAAIVGGGIKAFKIEIQTITSLNRQLMLGGLGLTLVIVGVVMTINEKPANASVETVQPTVATNTNENPSVALANLPATIQAGLTYAVEAEVDGPYTRIEFSTDNGILEAGVSDELAFWTPLEAGKYGSLKVEVFYEGNSTIDTFTANIEKATQPICPPELLISEPEENGEIEEHFKIVGQASPVTEGTILRVAMWPAGSNNYHPQSVIPNSETWTLTSHAGAPGEAGTGSKFDLVILATNAVSDFYIEAYLREAEENNEWAGCQTWKRLQNACASKT